MSSADNLTIIPTELSLQLEGIEHRTTKPRWQQSTYFIEPHHRTLLDEHFRIKGRTTWYESVDQMQIDKDSYLKHYDTQRLHQRWMTEGLPHTQHAQDWSEIDTEEGAMYSIVSKAQIRSRSLVIARYAYPVTILLIIFIDK